MLPTYIKDVIKITNEYNNTEISRKLKVDIENSKNVFINASGRTFLSILIPFEVKRDEEFKYIFVGDTSRFPGIKVRDCLNFVKDCLVITASGSGKTKIVLEQFKEIENQKHYVITANESSPLFQEASSRGLPIIIVKDLKEEREFKKGIMGDSFELFCLLFFSSLVFDIKFDEREIEKRIKENEEKIYELIEKIVKGGNVFVGGFGPAEHVAECVAIRLQHILYPLNRLSLPVGHFGYHKPGDIVILISYSGKENPLIRQIIESCEKRKIECFLISKEDGFINTFTKNRIEHYVYSYVILSTIIFKVLEEFINLGLTLNNDVLRWYHSIFK